MAFLSDCQTTIATWYKFEYNLNIIISNVLYPEIDIIRLLHEKQLNSI